MKPQIVDGLGIMLLRKGFVVKNLTRTCFDLLARKDGKILLVKVLEDANSVSFEHTLDMNRVASYLNASPLIISEKAGDMLQDNIIYSRFNIFTLTPKTFELALDNRLPFLRRTNAGITAHIKGEELKRMREKQELSLQNLSRSIGVSRRMISKYENEGADITLSKAAKLYDLLGHQVFDKVEIFSHVGKPDHEKGSVLTKKYQDLGFDASMTKNVPFDVIAKKDNELILTGVGDKPSKHLSSLSMMIDADNLVIFKKKKPKGHPAMSKKDFLELEKAAELVKFVHDEKYL
ncbi:MAG: helix-turn-helix domain-containing protein [Nanoarchaeota archaeon]|nr:helix-turn-helix domain-containing protein [Nanoarchaeota archaeon]